MSREKTTTASQPTAQRGRKVFTADEANRALVLVRRIMTDIVERYGRMLDLRSQYHELSGLVGSAPRLAKLQVGMEEARADVHRLHEELTEIGCELKDWASGLVDFPAVHQGRKVWLCWRLGETAVTHWHELSAGFAGRKPIGPDF